MWKLAYNLVIHLVFPLFALIALTRKKMRVNFLERLCGRITPAHAPLLWIHAASIGESVIAENLVNYLREHGPATQFLLTTNTYYARDLLRKRLQGRASVASLPFDLPGSISRFLQGSVFRGLILVETELWPNLIWAARARQIPVVIVNGRISDATLAHYRRFSFFLKHVLSGVDLVIAQSEEQKERFCSIGMDPARVTHTGNLKYYRFLDSSAERPPKEDLITFGSVKEKEVPLLLPIIQTLTRSFPGYAVYVVPREITLIDTIEEKLSSHLAVTRFSAIKEGGTAAAGVVVVDTVGDLMAIYSRSRVAFVGGSLAPYGGQNILEPLFFGTPVLFGPHIENFREVGELILSAGAGIMVQDAGELLERIVTLLKDPAQCAALGDAGLRIIHRQEGVMARAANLIVEATWKSSTGSPS
jgi:3-deoxy-D-manno-octulosonic-acid transferase